MKDDFTHMVKCYGEQFSRKGSFKENWDGQIALKYKSPKYIDLFFKEFKNLKNISVLELGAEMVK